MIKIEHLTKKYGNHIAVNDLNLDIEPGRIYGFLGPNGAGKSTTMNIITGYLAATEGTVSINGYDIFKEPNRAKACIGYLPEIPPLYPDMTVLEYMAYAAELKGIPRSKRDEEVDEACIMTGITDVAGRMIRNLSKGYKQRVGLAQAILGKPEIIILDEPTVGLDPAQIIEVRDLIRELGKEHTVILSSHILSEISEVCNYVFIISKGRLVAADETEKLLSDMSGTRETSVVLGRDSGTADGTDFGIYENEYDSIVSVYGSIDGVDEAEAVPGIEPGTIRIVLKSAADRDVRAGVFKTAVARGHVILEMTGRSRSLEDVFLELTQTDETAEITEKTAGDESGLSDSASDGAQTAGSGMTDNSHPGTSPGVDAEDDSHPGASPDTDEEDEDEDVLAPESYHILGKLIPGLGSSKGGDEE